jgi:hypothetical protein
LIDRAEEISIVGLLFAGVLFAEERSRARANCAHSTAWVAAWLHH